MSLLRVVFVGGCCLAMLYGQTDWPVFGHDPGATRYSPLKQINARQYRPLAARLDVSQRQAGLGGDARGRGRRDVPDPAERHLRARAGNRQADLAVSKPTGAALRGLAYWPGQRTTHPRVFAGVSEQAGGHRRHHRQAGARVRQRGRHRSEAGRAGRSAGGALSLRLAAGGLQGHRHHRQQQRRRARRARAPTATSAAGMRAPGSWCGPSTPCRAPASRATTPGRRRLEEPLRHQHLGLPHRRRRARDGVRPARFADLRFLRRGPPWQRALRQQPASRSTRRPAR